MSEDPIGFLGGDTNLYRYVGNQPLIFRDPYGLDWQDSVGAVGDFYKNYSDMRDKNVKNSDKYFHCMANCQASSRGPDGLSMAQNLSNLRESFDENIKGDSSQACQADIAANSQGQIGGSLGNSCSAACESYKVNGL